MNPPPGLSSKFDSTLWVENRFIKIRHAHEPMNRPDILSVNDGSGKGIWMISKLVEVQRGGMGEMLSGSMGPEEKSSCLQPRGISLFLGLAAVFSFSPDLSSHATAALCGRQTGEIMKSNIPPMLAAQSAFLSGPLLGFHKILGQLIWRCWPFLLS